MKSETKTNPVTIQTRVLADIDSAWKCFTSPVHIMQWNHASDDWHCPRSENDLRVGGKFSATMAANDGSASFEFEGVYDEVVDKKRIAYTMLDGRKVVVDFNGDGSVTNVIEKFDPESENPVEFQRAGWQAILDNYSQYTEEVAGELKERA